MKADLIRGKFLQYFKLRGHKIVPSDSLVPHDDNTVLFTPAGMNQFKKEFMGFNSGFKRAATAQRCLRTDDLEKVGKTACHHTMFEMLGNFSFGDYFKEDAICWSWEFLTKELKIPDSRLWVSVYNDDKEAYDKWSKVIKLASLRIVKLGDKDNFWPSEAKEKGPNGPCGPCSEIFYDFGEKAGCGKVSCSPGCSCGRFVEVWNLVFTQFNRKDGGLLESLPNKNIDTGMGLERLAAVMQGVYSNFETDLFIPLTREIGNSVPLPEAELVNAVADHIRAVVFSIYDGVMPSNEKRGYIVRKIIRKSVYHMASMGAKQPFLYKLVPVVADTMSEPYPELSSRREDIAEVILAEEKSFLDILKSSDKYLSEKFVDSKSAASTDANADIAFQLYDTYGLPIEVTTKWLKEKYKAGISMDKLHSNIMEQKNRSKVQSAMKGDVFEDGSFKAVAKDTRFSGYNESESKSKIIKILKNNDEAKKIAKGDEAVLILDKSPFYAESGGQVGDTGKITKGKSIFVVKNTKKIGNVILHYGVVNLGSFTKGSQVVSIIDSGRRLAIARNHTATHLLQSALRTTLGAHVKQQGSLVDSEKLRFDFSHFKALSQQELERTEDLVNSYILEGIDLAVKKTSLNLAKKTGALAFFGDKYDNDVRVVEIGNVSKELCGGTHLASTSQIGVFKITQESSVAQGVRRIEALTGKAAYELLKNESRTLAQISSILNTGQDKIIDELNKKQDKLKQLEKELYSQKLNSTRQNIDGLVSGPELINGINIIAHILKDYDMELLRKTVDLVKARVRNSAIILGSSVKGKVFLVVGLTNDLCEKGMDASSLIRIIAKAIGGSGGGRKDFAQAGGDKPENLESTINEFKKQIKEMRL